MDQIIEYSTGISIGVILFLLILIKNIIDVRKNIKSRTPWILLIVTLTALLALIPVAFIFLLIFVIYRQIVRLLLQIKYRGRFGGLVEGSDATHTIDDPKNSTIFILMMVEFNHNLCSDEFFDVFKQTARKMFFENPKKFPKFHSAYHTFMGYTFMLKEDIPIDECVRKIDMISNQNDEMDKKELMKLLSHCYSWPLPRNQSILWDILISTQPVNWRENTTKGIKYYPALIRIHHSVADGVALLQFCAGVLGDKDNLKIVSTNIFHEKSAATSDNKYNPQSLKSVKKTYVSLWNIISYMLKCIFLGIYVILLFPSSLYVNLLLKAKDKNILCSPKLTGDEILAMNVEESDNYVQKIRKIKSKLSGAAFPEIVLTAFSASLKDYFQKNSQERPDYITGAVPVLPGSEELSNLIPGGIDINDISFCNSYSLLMLSLPIFMDNEQGTKTPLIDRFKIINKETKILKQSVDYYVNYLLMSVIFPLLPNPIIRSILSNSQCTIILSILPGPPKISYAEGKLKISDLVFWTPHLKNTGVCLSVLSYDKKLQVAFSADKGLIPDQESAQFIADGVYKYLDDFEEEIKTLA